MNDLPLTAPLIAPLTATDAWGDAAPSTVSPSAARVNQPEYTVSELSLALKRAIEDGFGYVRVRGEVSGWKRHASGHCYFALKDSEAVLDAVCWRSTALPPRHQARGRDGGRLQRPADDLSRPLEIPARRRAIELAGIGALLKLLEERRQRLLAEGLFAAERKKKLPFLPEVIGIVTSPTGAVIRDILHRLADRFPRRVLLWPVAVQGEGAAAQVAAAIDGFNRLAGGLADSVPRPDLIIVARGGGSLEDLMAFNEEIVVRAAAASAIPLISAVGHETDTTLIDHASDRRAPTPTAAAEMAVPVRLDLIAELGGKAARLAGGLSRLFDRAPAAPRRPGARPARPAGSARRRGAASRRPRRAAAAGDRRARSRRHGSSLDLAAAGLRPAALAADIGRARERFAEVETPAGRRRWRARSPASSDALDNFAGRLATHSERHDSLLARGYVVVRDASGGVVTEAATVRPQRRP